MTLEILMSCMYQQDLSLVTHSQITGSAVVINQCDEENYTEFSTRHGTARMFSTKQRGLTRSRNMAIREAKAEICMLCDDDEVFVEGYEKKILQAYEKLPQADVILFKIGNWKQPFPEETVRIRFPKTMKGSSCQISFRRESLLRTGVRFDDLLGAGSGNGAEEELKFFLDCEKAGLKIYSVPVEVAALVQSESTWFRGFTEQFFENRGATTRYILGLPLAMVYAVYYVVRKREMYAAQVKPWTAFKALCRGMKENKISKQAQQL